MKSPLLLKPSWRPFPKGLVTRMPQDNLGRVSKQVEHSTNGTVTDTSKKTTEYPHSAVGRATVKVVSPPCR